jgi:hypothetical protein
MLQVVAGPVLLAAGLFIIYCALNGVPSALSLDRIIPARRGSGRTIPAGDALVVEMLTEMLTLREQIAALQEQVGSLKGSRPRKTTKAA